LPRRVAFAAALVALAAAAWAALDPARGGIALLLAVVAVLVAAAAHLEATPGSVRDVTLVATLAGIATAGRVLLHPLPGVQPMTVVVAAAGAALGPGHGFAVGALGALTSNFFLGQGPHTPWQMLAWGGCGLLAGLARRLLEGRVAFGLFCFALGFAFGIFTDLWHWYAFYPHTWTALTVVLGAGVAFNAAHAVGNIVIAFVAGPELRRVLTRYERRLRTEVVWT
jgi:energy-coupling factor transport system substrate-specific component